MDVLANRDEHAAHGHVLEGLAASPLVGALSSGKERNRPYPPVLYEQSGGFGVWCLRVVIG